MPWRFLRGDSRVETIGSHFQLSKISQSLNQSLFECVVHRVVQDDAAQSLVQGVVNTCRFSRAWTERHLARRCVVPGQGSSASVRRTRLERSQTPQPLMTRAAWRKILRSTAALAFGTAGTCRRVAATFRWGDRPPVQPRTCTRHDRPAEIRSCRTMRLTLPGRPEST